MTQEYLEKVIIYHRPYKTADLSHRVQVYDHQSRELVFEDTLRGVADWLDIFGYKWVSGSAGVWQKCPATSITC